MFAMYIYVQLYRKPSVSFCSELSSGHPQSTLQVCPVRAGPVPRHRGTDQLQDVSRRLEHNTARRDQRGRVQR